LRRILGDVDLYARTIGKPLRRYQVEPARAIVRAVVERSGRSVTVMMSRQAGKNQLSAICEGYLLTRYQSTVGAQVVKTAPTLRPQLVNSILRLRRILDNPLTRGRWRDELGYIIRLGQARVMFLSAGPGASVVGATASLALEFDEAQDIDQERHDRDFSPMAASTNAARIYYGTAWTEDTLLARAEAECLEAQRRDGVRRAYRVRWEEVAEVVPEYGQFVEAERARLGESHPLFRTQYELETVAGGGRLFSAQQVSQMEGRHGRLRRRADEGVYVAGVDIAGEDEEAADAALRSVKPRKDSTVVTIARLDYADVAPGIMDPRLEVVEHYWWTGRDHRTQFAGLLDLLREVWGVARVCVDGTGVGAGVASFLLAALGEVVCEVVQFTAPRKSELGYGLLAAVNSGRFKVYQETEQSAELREWWAQAEASRYEVRGNQLLAFYVPEEEGHDDFVVSAALCVAAGASYVRAPAAAVVRARPMYEGERWR